MDNYNQLEYQQHQLESRQNSGLLETESERQTGLFLHLSVLANMIFPFAGVVLPIIIWQTKKEQMPAITPHGKEVTNWLITSFIYSLLNITMLVVGVVLIISGTAPVLGILLAAVNVLLAIGFSIVNIVYAIYGGVKASNGEHWEYPFNIKFLK